jgi:hypothetical protein
VSSTANLRYAKTLEFLERFASREERILDLGTPNPFSQQMLEKGYQVSNTQGEDFDEEYLQVARYPFDCMTSFEVFEHLMAPYNLLKAMEPQGDKPIKLIASVPLKVWFAKAYWNPREAWDRHYHEFEPRQFDWLLEKTGWQIKHSETWTSPSRLAVGIRPLLRFLWPSYYFVCAIKEK